MVKEDVTCKVTVFGCMCAVTMLTNQKFREFLGFASHPPIQNCANKYLAMVTICCSPTGTAG
jgi:hypothetical protein